MTAPKGAPTPKRPPLARKHTPQTEAKRNAALDQGLRVTFQGQLYEVREGDLTAMHVRDLRKELGVSWMGLMKGLMEDPDLDLIVGLIWLSRRVQGEGIPYAAVASEIGYLAAEGLVFEQLTEPEQVDDNPEG